MRKTVQHTTVECDICGLIVDEGLYSHAWKQLGDYESSGKKIIIDMCPDCVKSFIEWQRHQRLQREDQ